MTFDLDLRFELVQDSQLNPASDLYINPPPVIEDPPELEDLPILEDPIGKILWSA